MRFLADESCDFAVVRALRESRHDVVAVAQAARGAKDSEVIALAREGWRGDAPAARRLPAPATVGVIAPAPAWARVYGQEHEILGPLKGPNGATAQAWTIWIVPTGESAPRLVTGIP